MKLNVIERRSLKIISSAQSHKNVKIFGRHCTSRFKQEEAKYECIDSFVLQISLLNMCGFSFGAKKFLQIDRFDRSNANQFLQIGRFNKSNVY